MIQSARVLQPLAEEAAAVHALSEYGGPAELTEALLRVWAAVDRVLRLLLRGNTQVPDEVRLMALAPAEMPLHEVVSQLRASELLPLELAGMTHELGLAAERARRGDPRAADADLAIQTVSRLRSHVQALGDQPLAEAAHHAIETRILEEPTRTVPPPAPPSRRAVFIAAAALTLLILGLVAVLMLLHRDNTMAAAIVAFQEGRWSIAEMRFREVVARQPENVTAQLYLGRIYRLEGEPDKAAAVLQNAARVAPDDPAVRRELGYLFLDLNRPQAAAEQFRRALSEDPETRANWVGLIRALRAAGDPSAEDMLRRAPPDVRSLFPEPH